VIIRIFASYYEGDISILNYGYIIAQVPLLIIETLTIYVFYPLFVERSISPDNDYFRRTILKFLHVMFFVIIPISVMMIITSNLISRVLFLHGKFNWATADETGVAIAFFSIGLLGLAIESTAIRVAIILEKMKDYFFLLIMRLVFNVLLIYILIRVFAPVTALSLSFSIAVLFYGVGLMVYIGRNILHKFGKKFFVYVSKIMFSSAIAGVIVYTIKIIFENSTFLTGFLPRLIALITTLFVGTLVYILLLYFMRIKELEWLKKVFIRKLDI